MNSLPARKTRPCVSSTRKAAVSSIRVSPSPLPVGCELILHSADSPEIQAFSRGARGARYLSGRCTTAHNRVPAKFRGLRDGARALGESASGIRPPGCQQESTAEGKVPSKCSLTCVDGFGGAEGDRTLDLRIAKAMCDL